jgi:hypothetical protein
VDCRSARFGAAGTYQTVSKEPSSRGFTIVHLQGKVDCQSARFGAAGISWEENH